MLFTNCAMKNISGFRGDGSTGIKSRLFFNPVIFALITEVGLNFFRFLRSIGLSDERNFVVLSSRYNYACNEHELKNARIIINLKKLNLIKHLDLFLNSLVRILPPNTSFIGYFSDEKPGNGFSTGYVQRVVSRMFNLMGAHKNHIMNRDEVTELLEKNGFKTLNMKEMNGLTYFISQNVSMPLL
jgi:hypothetical protein